MSEDRKMDAAHQHMLIEQWLKWRKDTRKYAPPAPRSTMASIFNNGFVRSHFDGPDAERIPGMHFIELAYRALQDQHPREWAAFHTYYIRRAKHIKREAERLGISRKTFYAARDRYRARMVSQARCMSVSTVGNAIFNAGLPLECRS